MITEKENRKSVKLADLQPVTPHVKVNEIEIGENEGLILHYRDMEILFPAISNGWFLVKTDLGSVYTHFYTVVDKETNKYYYKRKKDELLES